MGKGRSINMELMSYHIPTYNILYMYMPHIDHIVLYIHIVHMAQLSQFKVCLPEVTQRHQTLD